MYVGRRCSSDPVLLWLWHRPAATAPIRPLAWELPCAMGAALKKTKDGKKKKHSATAVQIQTFSTLYENKTKIRYIQIDEISVISVLQIEVPSPKVSGKRIIVLFKSLKTAAI